MSLINDMLRDLETRRPAGGREALKGVSAVRRGRGVRLLRWGVAGLALVLAVCAAVLWAAYRPMEPRGQGVPAGPAAPASDGAPSAAVAATPEPDPKVTGSVGAQADLRRIEAARVESAERGVALVLTGSERLPFELQRLEAGSHLRIKLPATRLATTFPDLAGATPLVRTVSAAPGEQALQLDLWLVEGTGAQTFARDDGVEVVIRLVGPPDEERASEGNPTPADEVVEARPAAKPKVTAAAGGHAEDADRPEAAGTEQSPTRQTAAAEQNEAEASRSRAGFSKDRRQKAGASLKRLTDRAGERLQAGDTGGAIADLREVLRADADRHEARSLLARAYVAGGRISAAVQLLEQGLALAPEHTPFLLQLARLLAGAGESEAALDVLARRAPREPGGEFHALEGALAQQLGHYERSAAAYRRAVAASPDRAGWQVGLAIALEGQGRESEALRHYREGLARGGLKPALRAYAEQRVASMRAR